MCGINSNGKRSPKRYLYRVVADWCLSYRNTSYLGARVKDALNVRAACLWKISRRFRRNEDAGARRGVQHAQRGGAHALCASPSLNGRLLLELHPRLPHAESASGEADM